MSEHRQAPGQAPVPPEGSSSVAWCLPDLQSTTCAIRSDGACLHYERPGREEAMVINALPPKFNSWKTHLTRRCERNYRGPIDADRLFEEYLEVARDPHIFDLDEMLDHAGDGVCLYLIVGLILPPDPRLATEAAWIYDDSNPFRHYFTLTKTNGPPVLAVIPLEACRSAERQTSRGHLEVYVLLKGSNSLSQPYKYREGMNRIFWFHEFRASGATTLKGRHRYWKNMALTTALRHVEAQKRTDSVALPGIDDWTPDIEASDSLASGLNPVAGNQYADDHEASNSEDSEPYSDSESEGETTTPTASTHDAVPPQHNPGSLASRR